MQVNRSISKFDDKWAGGGGMKGTYQRGASGCGGSDSNSGNGCC
jgi:hypothetical protein